MITPCSHRKITAAETDAMVSDLLDLLGWRHDRTGPKGKPFAPSFDVLGLTLDMASLSQEGIVTLKNKEGRGCHSFGKKMKALFLQTKICEVSQIRINKNPLCLVVNKHLLKVETSNQTW